MFKLPIFKKQKIIQTKKSVVFSFKANYQQFFVDFKAKKFKNMIFEFLAKF